MIFWKFIATFRPFLLKNEDFFTFIKHCLKWQSLAVFTVAVAVTVQCDPFSDTVEDPASPGVFLQKTHVTYWLPTSDKLMNDQE